VAIKEKLNKDLIENLKAGQSENVQLLRGVLAVLKNIEIKESDPLDDKRIIEILRGEIKQRREAIEQYQKGKRLDLAQKEEAEIKLIERYLPAELSEKKIEIEVKKAIEKTGAQGKQDLGKVMGTVMAKLKGQADGTTVSRIAQKILR
jgi:uncharacterized protein